MPYTSMPIRLPATMFRSVPHRGSRPRSASLPEMTFRCWRRCPPPCSDPVARAPSWITIPPSMFMTTRVPVMSVPMKLPATTLSSFLNR